MSLEQLDSIREEAQALTQRFVAAGWRLYLVGGVVRDALRGQPLGLATDLDFTTDAEPPAVKALLEGWADTVWTQGERFGTIGARRGRRSYEITTHRTEIYQPNSRKPEVAFTTAIEADLSRRDFTINAMAVELPNGSLVDPFDGASDLAARLLRTPLAPEETFFDDPLRMMRAARFLAQLDMTADPSLVAAMRTMADRIEVVAAERIVNELRRLLILPNPVPGLALMFETGLATPVLKTEINSSAALDRLSRVPDNPVTRLAALLADVDSVDNLRLILSELRLPAGVGQMVSSTLVAARQAVNQPPQNVPDLRRWVIDAGDDWEQAAHLTAALGGPPALAEEAAALLAVEPDLGEPLVLDGVEIMALLGLEPGPKVGAALEELHRHRMEFGPLTPDQARHHLQQWADL